MLFFESEGTYLENFDNLSKKISKKCARTLKRIKAKHWEIDF
jgi:hypothetical protein